LKESKLNKHIENFNIDEFHINVGKNVKRIRKEKKISQMVLSHEMGYKSVTVLSRAEVYHDKYHFNLEQLAKIAYLLNVDMSEFFKS